MATVLSDSHVNILSATSATGRDRIARLRFTFELADIAHLSNVLGAVKKVDGVFDAYRVAVRARCGSSCSGWPARRVAVDGERVAGIGPGFLLLVGAGREDLEDEPERLADKIANLRVFADADGKMNLALADVGGEVLVVSQFTLYGDVRKGRRPSWTRRRRSRTRPPSAWRRSPARSRRGVSRVGPGVFGAHMEVELVNDGPVTLVLDGAATRARRTAAATIGSLMWLDVFDRNPYGTNCWLLAADGSDEAVVVDPGFEPEAVHALLEAAGRRPVAVLLTHAHVDHAWRAGDFCGDDVPVYIHTADDLAFSDPVAWGAGFDDPLAPGEGPAHDRRRRRRCGWPAWRIEVLHTPGHTPGQLLLPHRRGRAPALGRPGVRGHDRAVGLPELVADGHGERACGGS